MRGISGALVALVGLILSSFDISDRLLKDYPYLISLLNDVIPFIQLAILTAILLILIDIVRDLPTFKRIFFHNGVLTWRNAKLDDISGIQKLGEDFIGDVCDENILSDLFSHNQKSIKVMINKAKGEIVGYFILIPLTQKGVKMIHEDDFDLTQRDFTVFQKNWLRRGGAYYVAGVVGATKPARDYTRRTLHLFCINRGVETLYARAATRAGLTSLKRNDFVPVHAVDTSSVGVLFLRHK